MYIEQRMEYLRSNIRISEWHQYQIMSSATGRLQQLGRLI